MRIRASPTIPLIAQAQWRSISTSFSLRPYGTMRVALCNFFSTPRITPSLVFTPMAVEPNYTNIKVTCFRKWSNLCRAEICLNQEMPAGSISIQNSSVLEKTYLNSFDSILDLIDTTFGWERVHASVILFLTIRQNKTKVMVLYSLWLTCPSTWLLFLSVFSNNLLSKKSQILY